MEDKNLFLIGIILGIVSFLAGLFISILILLINYMIILKRLPKDFRNAKLLWIIPLVAVAVNILLTVLLTGLAILSFGVLG